MGRHVHRAGVGHMFVRSALVATAVAVSAWSFVTVGTVHRPTGTVCPALPLNISAAPTVAAPLRQALEPVQGRPLGTSCLAVQVDAVPSGQVVLDLAGQGKAGATPDLWVPDWSIWIGQVPPSQVRVLEPSLAWSPIVLMSSTSVVEHLGWNSGQPPRWADALTGAHPVDADFSSAPVLGAVLALRATADDEQDFAARLAALSIASYAPLAGDPSAAMLLAEGSASTPLIPTSEQAALGSGRNAAQNVRLVYPREGSPALDHPLVELTSARSDDPATADVVAAAVAVVRAQLATPEARRAFLDAGLRTPDGGVPDSVDAGRTVLRALDLPQPAEVKRIIEDARRTGITSRVLAVIDVSVSMRAEAAPGLSRIDLLVGAAGVALRTLPSNTMVGAWEFAARLEGKRDWVSLSPIRPLGASEGESTHRDTLVSRLATLPDDLRPGGTGLYDTVDAAVAEMRRTHDAQAENLVVVFTDGANDDRGGLTLQATVSRLKSVQDRQVVRLVLVGIGPDVDLDALSRLAEATPGGGAYSVKKPEELGGVLVDVLSRRV